MANDPDPVAYLRELLAEFYTAEETERWFSSPQRLLNGDTPIQRIERGEIIDVVALGCQLKEGAFV